MKDFLLALVAGVIGGIISPFIVSLLQHFVIWKSQKRLEIKHSIFSDTVRALSMCATDALDPALQDQHKEEHGHYLRPETRQLLQEARGLVHAFFSDATHRAVQDAMGEKLTRDTAPSMEYERKRAKAILKMAGELGISNRKEPNQASGATSEPAPGAASSAHQD